MADRAQFDRVSKRYVLGERNNAREALAKLGRRLMAKDHDTANDLWSLRDVSFSVSDGEALGIVGRNGAGKSTILRILSRITSPTRGVARSRGRVASLLEVGTGFHPELSGRENIYLNGAILGMSRRDISARFDQIVDFAGVERFLHTPVKRYSSGMYLRLAFSVAAHLEPDVLVVDEILAVGDAEFQRKCIGRMTEAGNEGRTILFVSHDLETLAKLCPRSLWLEAGRLRDDGPTREVLSRYLTSSVSEQAGALVQAGPVTLRAVRVVGQQGSEGGSLLRDEGLRIEVDFDLAETLADMDIEISVTTSGGAQILNEALRDRGALRIERGRHRAELEIPPVLNAGEFTIGVAIGTAYELLLHEPTAAVFTLHGANRDYRPNRLVVLNLPVKVRPRDPAIQGRVPAS